MIRIHKNTDIVNDGDLVDFWGQTGNAEYTSFKDCCSYIRMVIWSRNGMKGMFTNYLSIRVSI